MPNRAAKAAHRSPKGEDGCTTNEICLHAATHRVSRRDDSSRYLDKSAPAQKG
jgi:hypothetical protein